MGYERQAPAPSPLQMLAIFQAKTKGVPLCEIAARTRFSMSTLIRWWSKWGHEFSLLEKLKQGDQDVHQDTSFEAFYPDTEARAEAAQVEEADGTVRVLRQAGDEQAETLPAENAAN